MFNRSALAARQWSAKPEVVAAQLRRVAPGSSLRSFSSSQATNEADGPSSSTSLDAQPRSNVTERNVNGNNGPLLRRPAGQPLRIRNVQNANDGASQPGRMGPVLRAPRGFKLLHNLKRMEGGGLRGPRGGPRKMGQRGGRKGAAAGQRRRKKEESYGDEEDEYANLTEEQQQELLAKIEEERPKPVRYNPKGEDIESLLPTWPSLPIGDVAKKQTVLSRLDSMGARFANGFEAPSDLARRLLEGKMVHFRSEEEKAKTLEIAQEMAQEKAAAEGEEAAKEIKFNVVDDKIRSDLLNNLIAGSYSQKAPEVPEDASPALSDAIRLLKNNETYHSEDINKFITLLSKSVPNVKAKP